MNPNSPSDPLQILESDQLQHPGPAAGPAAAPQQLHAYLFRLVDQTDTIQAQLHRLLEESQLSGVQLAALIRDLTSLSSAPAQQERLVDLVDRFETAQGRLDELAQTVTKLSRTQFKSNSLAEVREQQIAASLATLQEIALRREEIQAGREDQERQHRAVVRASARAEFVIELLPLLDGLELAMESAKRLLEQRRQQAVQAARAQIPVAKPLSIGERVRMFFNPAPDLAAARQEEPAKPDKMVESLAAWWQGLDLVRQRFLSLLATEDIQPISVLQQPFDPRMQVAMITEERTDVPPDTVVKELRKGYRQRDRVLRYAEVSVARAPNTNTEAQDTPL
ncbi:MAG: nucleotide exchange factor GrpE [Chloroflexi bacterium]|nr:nucleotide exchange factor GrpE [Chloroflexota bacterium]